MLSDAMEAALKANERACRQLESLTGNSYDSGSMRDNVEWGQVTLTDVRKDNATLKRLIKYFKKNGDMKAVKIPKNTQKKKCTFNKQKCASMKRR